MEIEEPEGEEAFMDDVHAGSFPISKVSKANLESFSSLNSAAVKRFPFGFLQLLSFFKHYFSKHTFKKKQLPGMGSGRQLWHGSTCTRENWGEVGFATGSRTALVSLMRERRRSIRVHAGDITTGCM